MYKLPIKFYVVTLSVVFLFIYYWAILGIANTDNIGSFLYRARDNQVYLESVWRLLTGLSQGDVHFAFSGSTMGYGFGYFLILSFFSLPSYITQNDSALSFALIATNLIAYILIIGQIIVLAYNQIPSPSQNKYLFSFLFVLVIIVLVIPATNFLLVNLHPELWQSVFFIGSAGFFFKYAHTRSTRDITLTALLFGFSVGIKISILPIAIVYLVFLAWLHKDGNVRSGLSNLAVGIIAFIVSTCLSVNPLFVINPIETFSNTINEFQMFSGGLNVNAIADWNYYYPLDTRIESILAWFYYPYTKALIGAPLTIILFIITALILSLKSISYRNKFNLAFALTCHVVYALFLVSISTRISSFYLIPTFLLFIAVASPTIFSIDAIMDKFKTYEFGDKFRFIFTFFSNNMGRNVAIFLFGLILLAQIYMNAMSISEFNRLALFRKLSDSHRNEISANTAIDFIRTSGLPKGSVLFDIEAYVPFSSTDWGYSPGGDPFPTANDFQSTSPTTNTWKISLAGNLEEEPYSKEIAPFQDLFFISKKDGNLAALPYLISQGMNNVYEDASLLVMSRNEIAYPDSFPEDSYWSGDNQAPDDPGFELEWNHSDWQGVIYSWANFVNLNEIQQISLKFMAEPKNSPNAGIQSLRFGFSGSKESLKNDWTNTWHIELKSFVVPGLNVIELTPEQFYSSTGKVSWGYTGSVFFGGVAKDWNIKYVDLDLSE